MERSFYKLIVSLNWLEVHLMYDGLGSLQLGSLFSFDTIGVQKTEIHLRKRERHYVRYPEGCHVKLAWF